MLWTAQSTADPEFGAGRFSPGYQTTALLPFAWEGRQLIAWSQTHHTWWPTILRVLDQNGASRSTWVHGGVFFALSFVTTNEGPLLLAGGVSNSQSAGVLIALDLRAANGHGPEPPATTFACANCSGTDLPMHYLAFPPTEMSAAFGVPYSRVYAINATAQGIEVRVRQGSLAGKDGVDVIYDFDTGFRLLRAHVADDYWLVHRQLEAKGVLHHRVEECPERRAPLGIRELSATGWRDVVPLEPAR
jgi:hypothetical protein